MPSFDPFMPPPEGIKPEPKKRKKASAPAPATDVVRVGGRNLVACPACGGYGAVADLRGGDRKWESCKKCGGGGRVWEDTLQQEATHAKKR